VEIDLVEWLIESANATITAQVILIKGNYLIAGESAET